MSINRIILIHSFIPPLIHLVVCKSKRYEICVVDLCFCLQPPPKCEEKQQESAMEELKGILVINNLCV